MSLVLIHEVGHQIIMEDGLVKIKSIKQNFKAIMTSYKYGGLLRLKGKVVPKKKYFVGAISSDISPIRLWHVRYGHLNFDCLSQLQRLGMVKALPTFKKDNAKCEACIHGKQNRETYPTRSWRENMCLQLVYNDICGLLESSLGGGKYFLLFIDDFSRMTWVYFLKEKSETIEKFKTLCHLIEKETNEKIEAFKTYNRGEFTSNEFQKYCKDKGIRRKFTNSYTPQQNGLK